ncbi:MAG: hypothetical protein HFJ28_02520 [Clostridia bacterium]|nr:hypothetical protein [Clostridia bacterium]
MKYYLVALGVWLVVCILLARRERVWRAVLGESSFGKEDQKNIKEMKEVAQRVFSGQKISSEQAKKYKIMEVTIDDQTEEIIVISQKAQVSISKNRMKVEHTARTKPDAIFSVFVYFFLLGIFAITIAFMLWKKYVG